MDFHTAYSLLIAHITPHPWDHTTPDGDTLRVIPACYPAGPGEAEVTLRLVTATAAAAGVTITDLVPDDADGATEIGLTTVALPGLIAALRDQTVWQHEQGYDEHIAVTPSPQGVALDADGLFGTRTQMTLSPAQRLPLASALERALDVAREWEDPEQP
ncbi:hypothetical protein [Streptomyces chumphonensis]|uniref:hypothetical protein n=1 Tax=Streptomyces chumphonensis TaxID=1214925 RepID=UPI003D723451